MPPRIVQFPYSLSIFRPFFFSPPLPFNGAINSASTVPSMPWNAYTAARFSQRVHAIGHRSRKHFNQHSSNSLVPRKLSSFLSLLSRFYFSSTCVAYSYTARNSMQLSAIRYGNIAATRNGRNKRFKENMYLEGRGGKIISKANISIDLWREIKDRVPILNFCISSKVEKLWATWKYFVNRKDGRTEKQMDRLY